MVMTRARILGCLFLFTATAVAARADDWPQWRGPRRNGVWRETGITLSLRGAASYGTQNVHTALPPATYYGAVDAAPGLPVSFLTARPWRYSRHGDPPHQQVGEVALLHGHEVQRWLRQ